MMIKIDNEDEPNDVDEQIDSSQVVIGFKNLQEKSFGQKSLKGFGHSPRQQLMKPIKSREANLYKSKQSNLAIPQDHIQ